MSFVNPAPGGTEARTDQGVDFVSIKGNIVAVTAGAISKVYQHLSGFGTTIIEKANNGQQIYYGLETGGGPVGLTPGTRVRQGQPVAFGLGTGGIEVGLWDPTTGRPVGAPQYTSEGVATQAGQNFRAMISGKASAGNSSLAQLWIQAGGAPALANTMAAIAMAESSGRTNATNKNSNGTVDRGLWQINSSHTQFDPKRLLSDPLYNAQAAVAIEKSQGLGAWTTYTSGAYQQFVGKTDSVQGGAASGASGYGGTRPGGQSQGGTTGGDLNNAYTSMRDQQRKAPTSGDVSLLSPFNWFLGQLSDDWGSLVSAAKTPGEAFGSIARLAGDTVKTIELLPWYGLRLVELIMGSVLFYLGMKQTSGAVRTTGDNLRHLTREVVLSTPGVGAEVRAAQGARMGRREGQREAARIQARGSEIARRRRDSQ